MTRIKNAVFNLFARREWTANRADPTQVIEWKFRGRNRRRIARRISLVMIVSWGVEAKLTVFGHTWRTYNHRLFVRLFEFLEGEYDNRQMAYDDDPMGSLSRYE